MEWIIPLAWAIPLFWLILTIVLLIIEVETFNLVSIWFAIGSMAAMIVSLINHEIIFVQIMVFLLLSILMMITTRNFAVKRLKVGTTKTNVNSLIGRQVKVTTTIEQFKYGEVKVNGNFWMAKSLNDETIEEDTIVEIVEISGVKLVVRPIEKTES